MTAALPAIPTIAAPLRRHSPKRLRVLSWAIPRLVAESLNAEFGTSFRGRAEAEFDFNIKVDRTRQMAAIARHTSQSTDNPVLWRRLELLGDREWRYLSRQIGSVSPPRERRRSRLGAKAD